MDPLTTAVVGAVSKLADQSISDLYQAIKSSLRKRYGSNSALLQSVDAVEANPVAIEPAERLHQEVIASEAYTLPEIAALTGELLKLTRISDNGARVSQVTMGDGNVVVGINHGLIR